MPFSTQDFPVVLTKNNWDAKLQIWFSVHRHSETYGSICWHYIYNQKKAETDRWSWKKGRRQNKEETHKEGVKKDRTAEDGSSMELNFLQLNHSKTQVILFGQNLHTKHPDSILCSLAPFYRISARNLDLIFDRCLKFDKQVSSVVKSRFYHLRIITKVKSDIFKGFWRNYSCLHYI